MKMKIKIKNIKVVPNDEGVQAVLKSEATRDNLLEYGERLAAELDEITDTDFPWEASIGERSKRLVVNVTNDDPVLKWKELKHGKVAKHMASKKYKRRGK